jgi:hypothetical protein
LSKLARSLLLLLLMRTVLQMLVLLLVLPVRDPRVLQMLVAVRLAMWVAWLVV